jgi:HrpA-like RNA helicase
LANLPVDVSLGKMLIMGTLFHQIESVMSLTAALSVQSPFTNDAFRNSDCVAARKNLDSDHGDPITLLNAYREWLQVCLFSLQFLGRGAYIYPNCEP